MGLIEALLWQRLRFLLRLSRFSGGEGNMILVLEVAVTEILLPYS